MLCFSLGLRGRVKETVRETATAVPVLFEGKINARWIPVPDLRLIVDGIPEDVAPHDGAFPGTKGEGANYTASRPRAARRPPPPARTGLTPPSGVEGPDIQALRTAARSLTEAIRLFLEATGGEG